MEVLRRKISGTKSEIDYCQTMIFILSTLSARKKLAVGILALALIMVSCTDRPLPKDLFVKEFRNADNIPRYEILELSFKHNGIYKNNFFDVSLETFFISPSGIQHRVKGFYYGNDMWKIRFRPDEVGRWTYTYLITNKINFRNEGKSSFYCTASNAEGPVRRHRENPYRWVFANGKAYFPVGLQDCVVAQGPSLLGGSIDGGTREEGGKKISWEEYFFIYGQAGFNLFRFSQKNCSYMLYDNLDHYREGESKATDELLSLARKHRLRVMFGFFGYHGKVTSKYWFMNVFKRTIHRIIGNWEEAIEKPDDYEIIKKEKRFIEYCIARWGVYVDFWELLNERKASDEWTTLMADYVRSIDPDRKPIGTSWEKPYLPAIDINAPHWYESESEFKSDLRIQEQAAEAKKAGKPVIVGEQGNTGMNWDPLSGLRMRIRTWTALFQEISFIFWNTSWSKAGADANIYLGPEERGYIRVLQDFASRLEADVFQVSVEVSEPNKARAYGLLSNNVGAVYLHHFENHTDMLRDLKITINLPHSIDSKTGLIGEWIDPTTGKIIRRVELASGKRSLEVPPFIIDLALLVTSKYDRVHLKNIGSDRAP